MRQLNCLAQFWNRQVEIALFFIGLSEYQVQEFIGWIQLQRVPELRNGSIILASQIQTPAQTEVNAEGERIQFACFIDLAEALLKTSHRGQQQRVALVSCGITWI